MAHCKIYCKIGSYTEKPSCMDEINPKDQEYCLWVYINSTEFQIE